MTRGVEAITDRIAELNTTPSPITDPNQRAAFDSIFAAARGSGNSSSFSATLGIDPNKAAQLLQGSAALTSIRSILGTGRSAAGVDPLAALTGAVSDGGFGGSADALLALLAGSDPNGAAVTGPAQTAAVAAVAEPAAPVSADLAEQVASAASEYTGIPYVWGGNDPNKGLDCSGFVKHVYQRVGIELPRLSADQARSGTPIDSMDNARPGDLLAWDTGPRNVGADHIAIYLGDGLMVEAPRRGENIKIGPVRPPDTISRIIDPGTPALKPGSVSTATPLTGARGAELAGVPYAGLFRSAGAEHGVDPALLASIAWQESRYKPNAVSHAGAEGLMQLMPATAAGLGVSNSFDPTEAVDGAARLMASHLRKYDGDVTLALAAYNAGGGNVDRYGGVPPFPETQHYVRVVQERFEELTR